jgi:Caspase domain
MAGRYRALLIGNSTYPADEHNLQTLKGPVKDIAAVNRALIDPATGLFADVDVSLLPEATSSRAIRALGRFFGTATRDDVLLVYFSGHGKLDQSGRLHLCMQDTESTDLLSTAVSSTRINEFADASRARNVIIVLDCCHAGAFRGGDLMDAVAGPGRYVLTSCRGTQLANDATVDNGTSYFTQHLVDGLLGAAADQDQDGYVTFSDLYAYVDRRLREAGKQIPQRRVTGDGDVPLARRRPPAPAEVSTAQGAPAEPGQAQEQPGSVPPPGPAVDGKGSSPGRSRRRVVLAAAAAAAVAGGAVTAVLLLTGGSGGSPATGHRVGTDGWVTTGPWRLRIYDSNPSDPPCSVTLTNEQSGATQSLTGLYHTWMFQQRAGSFRWQEHDPACVVTPLPGAGDRTLPLAWTLPGDSDAFAVPSRVAVQVKDYQGAQQCAITLNDAATGQALDAETATQGQNNDTVELDPGGRPTAFLSDLSCHVRVTRAS